MSILTAALLRMVTRMSLPSSPVWDCGTRPRSLSGRMTAADTRARWRGLLIYDPGKHPDASSLCPRASERELVGICFRQWFAGGMANPSKRSGMDGAFLRHGLPAARGGTCPASSPDYGSNLPMLQARQTSLVFVSNSAIPVPQPDARQMLR